MTVDYSTTDGTARAGIDYTADRRTLSFASGVTGQTFKVPIVNDNRVTDGADGDPDRSATPAPAPSPS